MNYVSIWLKSLILAVMLMVVMGGVTRLTHSGLSMVEWKPLHILPPLTNAAWDEEFFLYQHTPEYQKINKGMLLNEFKQIYWWEYTHRLLGRLVGVLVLLPFILLFKNIQVWLRWRIVGIFILGGIQGAIGWWMVKSGLKSDPAVSHIRLCIHLVIAFLILSTIALSLWRFQGQQFNKLNTKDTALLCVIGFTIIYGAFVAGLKAGFIYNTFPLMGDDWLPSEWNFYHPIWLNFINNSALVQFIHRVLAISVLTYSIILWRNYGNKYRLLSIKLLIQVLLGIATLLMQIPLVLALLHQLWAMVIWLVALRTVCLKTKEPLPIVPPFNKTAIIPKR